jgi:DNA-binding response OmpR family regulator
MNILLVDDDQSHAELLKVYLQAHNYTLSHCNDPRMTLPYLETHKVDVILLDVNMPHINGIDLCVMIRTKFDLPIIILTERVELSDRILGLELGADDYIGKPFEPLELVTRIKTINKRYVRIHELKEQQIQDQERAVSLSQQKPSIIQEGEIMIDVDRREARLKEELLPLSTIEWNTLYILIKYPGKVFSRDEIISQLHGVEIELITRSVDITISRLRTHLKDHHKTPMFIKTVWGAGYTFLPQHSDI